MVVIVKNKKLIFVVLASSVLFAFLTVNVLAGNMQGINNFVYMHIEQWINPALTSIMIAVSNAGDWFVYVPVLLVFIIVPKTRFKIGLPLTLGISVSVFLNEILKHIFAVARPDTHRLIRISEYGFPSAHAMNGTVFFGLCAYFFVKYSYTILHKRVERRFIPCNYAEWYKVPLNVCVVALAFGFIILMGLSRVYLGVHTAADVLGGYLAGIAVLSLIVTKEAAAC